MKRKLDEEEAAKRRREEAEGQGADGKARHEAASTIQRLHRGRFARKRVMRHIVSFATPVGLFVPADTVERLF
eukprot:3214153-Prymnesium_polylepis.1